MSSPPSLNLPSNLSSRETTSRAYIIDTHAHMTRGPGNILPATPLAPMSSTDEPRPGPPLTANDNVPNRFELFILGDGEKKVTEETDTRIPDASVFTFNKEDHTLGNMVSAQLHHNHHVLFAGYRVPHPLESKFICRIQTDGTLTPRAALIQACRELVHECALLNQEFTKEYELRKMVGANAATTAAATTAAATTAATTTAAATTGTGADGATGPSNGGAE